MAFVFRLIFAFLLLTSLPASAFFGAPAAGTTAAAADSSIADLNGDGRSDLLWRNVSSGQVYRMLMNGLAATGAAMAYAEPNLAWKIVADADFNGDGRSDVLWRNEETGAVYLMPFGATGLPSGGALVYTEPSVDWKIVHAPDLNGDGKADLLWWNSATGQVYAMLMNGSAITAQGLVYVEPNTNWRIAAVGDFAGSGKANQLVWRNGVSGHVFLMTVGFSGGVFSQSGAMIYQEPNVAWKVLTAADFNGDGRSDLLWRNDATGLVYMMLMNGASISGQGVVHNEPNLSWEIVAQGDYNGDGRADLLWRNSSTGQVYMMLMNGLAVASQGLVYHEPNLAWRLLGSWDYSGDDTLPMTAGTVTAAIESVAAGVYDVPPVCTGDVRINCPSGVPTPTPIDLAHGSLVVGASAPYGFSFNLQAVTLAPIRVDYVPFGYSCTVNVNTAPGAMTAVPVSGTATFSSTISNGTANRLQLGASSVDLEEADFSWNSGCLAVYVSAYLISYLEAQVQQMLSVLACGVPGPGLFGPCP